MAAAKGGWPVCNPVLRLAGAAYGGVKRLLRRFAATKAGV